MIYTIETALKEGREVSVPSSLREWLAKPKRHYIAGRLEDGRSGRAFTTKSPSNGETLATVALGEAAEAGVAVEAARAALERRDWARRPLPDRAKILREIGDRILEHRAELAILESLDTGKPLRESFEGDIPRAAQNFHFFSEFATAESLPAYAGEQALHFAVREPVGVAALVTPWNLPLYLATWKLAPCLLMGNSCVLKPSELTPLTASYLAERILADLDIPPGVFNLLHGFGESGAGEALVSHPGVDAISFTGETSTGRAIQRAASAGPTRVSFELGGKGATIVFADAPWERAMQGALRAAFRNQGEICLAGPRIYVEESRFEEFAQEFAARAGKIRVGPPLDPRTEMGALVSEGHWEKVMGYIERRGPGARVLTGGERPEGLSVGWYLRPTVITGVEPESPLTREEIFGPVAVLYPFREESEVVDAVNATPYGLSASVWSADGERGLRVSRALATGLVWVNCWFVRDLRVPFGGQKRSGVGREGGRHSLDFFSEWKSVCLWQEREERR